MKKFFGIWNLKRFQFSYGFNGFVNLKLTYISQIALLSSRLLSEVLFTVFDKNIEWQGPNFIDSNSLLQVTPCLKQAQYLTKYLAKSKRMNKNQIRSKIFHTCFRVICDHQCLKFISGESTLYQVVSSHIIEFFLIFPTLLQDHESLSCLGICEPSPIQS